MKLFNFSFTNEENIIFLLLILIIIILVFKSINKSTKTNNMWLPYEQFESVDEMSQQYNQSNEEYNEMGEEYNEMGEQYNQSNQQPEQELIFNGRSYEAPVIEEPHVISQLELQEKQFNELKQQIQISSLNTMSQESSYNVPQVIQKIFDTVNEVQQNVNTVSQEVQQNVNTVSQEVDDIYAGFNNEVDYTNIEQIQIPVEQKATSFNYIKSIDQVNSNDILDTYSLF